jgi:hypothetical protein
MGGVGVVSSRGPRITRDDYLAFLRTLEGQTLQTIGGRSRFTVEVEPSGGVCIRPATTQKPRRPTYRLIDLLLDRFAELGSYKPSNYQDINWSASYHLALIRRYLAS